MITAAVFLCLLAGHAAALWWYVRRTQSQPTLGEAYRDESANSNADPL